MSTFLNSAGSAALTIGASAALVGSAAFLAPFALIPFAKKNWILTYVNYGNGKMIKRGGEFEKFIISKPGSRLNVPNTDHFDPKQRAWEVIDYPTEDDDHYETRPKWMKRFGFYYVGIPGQRSVNTYKFSWIEENGHTPDGASILRNRPNETTEVFKVASFPYVIVESEIMTANNLPVKVVYIISMRISNPHLAFIDNVNWYASITAIISEHVKNFIGSFDIEQLVSLTDEVDETKRVKEMFAPPILAFNTRLAEEPEVGALGTKGKLGVTITAAEINRIYPFGPAAEAYMKALTAEFMAEKDGAVARIKADATAYTTTTEGTATANIIKATKLAEAAGNTALFEAAEKNPAGAQIVLGNDALKVAKATYVIPKEMTNIADGVAKALTGGTKK